jgi:hypothetical protein
MASVDWLMSLEPEFHSSIFGIYIFAGMVVAGLSIITLATIASVRARRPDLATEDRLYNLGALLFAFVCFWAYIAFSQYMLIWYGNLPDETSWMVRRTRGDWLGVTAALALVRFVIPFLALLPRRAKTNPRILAAVAALMLAGQFLDICWIVMPSAQREGMMLGWQELGPPALVIGLLALYAARFLGRHAAVPIGDPLFEESEKFRL